MVFSLFKKKNDNVYSMTWVSPQLAVGHAPMSVAELDSIKKQGVKAIMNLCVELEELAQLEQEHGFEVYYLPIMDEGYPELDELDKALDWLDESIYLGRKVLVHCRLGIGRTGTVVFSYLLRKGLDRKSAVKKMRGLRARPTEQPQKRFLHLYGKKEKPLSICEPSLVPESRFELKPYFDQVKDLLADTESDVPHEAARCGKHHTECCLRPVRLSLAEAVYLQFSLNSELGRELRQEAISLALRAEAADCPIVRDGRCLLYEFRPAVCRVFDRPGPETGVPRQQAEALQTLSDEILEIFLESKTAQSAPEFNLSEVVSGKFVQRFFHLLPNHK
ncbi:MAG: protein-tyrosine phosphatase family protein [Thermodesulfobacteriota bacterium]